MISHRCILNSVIVILFICIPLSAQEEEDRIIIHGFGGWYYSDTDGSLYQNATDAGTWDSWDLAVNVTAFATSRLRFTAQFYTANGINNNNTSFDFAFVEYKHSDQLRLRAGKIKDPTGIYGDILKVGTLRLFMTLPASIYENGFVSEGYSGVGIAGNQTWSNGWGVSYNLYGGTFSNPTVMYDFQTIALEVLMGIPNPYRWDTIHRVEELQFDETFGGRLIIETPVTGLNLGASLAHGNIEWEEGGIDGQVDMFMTHVEYNGDPVILRSEYAYSNIEDKALEATSAYVEVGVTIAENWQPVFRYDYGRWEAEPQLNPFISMFPSLGEHDEIAVGLNYIVHPGFIIRGSYHRIEGNMFAAPKNAISAFRGYLVGIPYEESTSLFMIGAHYSF